ncbi:MAG: hypothetical protein LKJ18_01940 [Ancrocorticia sp.]|jgi:hypothetical protein|nr:hypothetical protein [Ancrocorticia sp.]MCI1962900.1 hypothetical protein [Ancrocorticia sp.]MCI2001820.1 hypothetical protein [Ancrocorticia sp.]MCI2001873.1 hypothetical protein [Ancrocorticia sp.]
MSRKRLPFYIRLLTDPAEPGGGDPTPGNAANASGEQLGENGKKALQSEREARKAAEKAFAEASAKWEAEKAALTKQAQEASDAAAKAQIDAARASVFRAKNIPPELEKFVAGSTEEELEASADEVLAAFRPPAAEPSAPEVKPLGMRPDMTQGASTSPDGGDVDSLISAAENEKNYRKSLELKAVKLGKLAQIQN